MYSQKVSPLDIATAQQYNKLRKDAAWASSLLVHQAATPDMTVVIESWVFQWWDTRLSIPTQSLSWFSVPTTAGQKKLALIVMSAAWAFSIIDWTATSGTPTSPTVPVDKYPVAEIYLRNWATTILDDDNGTACYIIDKRYILQRQTTFVLNNFWEVPYDPVADTSVNIAGQLESDSWYTGSPWTLRGIIRAVANKIKSLVDAVSSINTALAWKASTSYVDSALTSKANDIDVLHKTGAETSTGLKKFENIGLQSQTPWDNNLRLDIADSTNRWTKWRMYFVRSRGTLAARTNTIVWDVLGILTFAWWSSGAEKNNWDIMVVDNGTRGIAKVGGMDIELDGIFDKWQKINGWLTNKLRIGTRYEISGILHSAMGHVMQILWWDARTAPEGTGSDGWWWLNFWPNWNPYLAMISEETRIGRTTWTVTMNGSIYASRNDAWETLSLTNTWGWFANEWVLRLTAWASSYWTGMDRHLIQGIAAAQQVFWVTNSGYIYSWSMVIANLSWNPEGSVSAAPWSLCMSANGRQYRKNTWTGTTGWCEVWAAWIEVDSGTSGTAKTIDWNNGIAQKVSMTGNCTFTLSNPTPWQTYVLKLTQDATGGRTATRPASCKKASGFALSTAANKVDIVTMYYDGTNFYLNIWKDYA